MYPGNQCIVFCCLFFLFCHRLLSALHGYSKGRGNSSPKQGVNKKAHPLLSGFYTIHVTLPIELKKDGDVFIITGEAFPAVHLMCKAKV